MKTTTFLEAPSVVVALMLEARGFIVKTGLRCLPMTLMRDVSSLCVFERIPRAPVLGLNRGPGERYLGHLYFNPERSTEKPPNPLERNWVFEVAGHKNLSKVQTLVAEMTKKLHVSVVILLRVED